MITLCRFSVCLCTNVTKTPRHIQHVNIYIYIWQIWLRGVAAPSLRAANCQVCGCHDNLASQWNLPTPLRGEQHRQLGRKKKEKKKRQVAADKARREGGEMKIITITKLQSHCFSHSAWRMHRPHTEQDGEVDKKRRRELEEAQLTSISERANVSKPSCCCVEFVLQFEKMHMSCRSTCWTCWWLNEDVVQLFFFSV